MAINSNLATTQSDKASTETSNSSADRVHVKYEGDDFTISFIEKMSRDFNDEVRRVAEILRKTKSF